MLSPSFLPGFTTSIDYYNINMGNALTTFSVQNVDDNCAAGSAVFCSAITTAAAVYQSSEMTKTRLRPKRSATCETAIVPMNRLSI